MSRKASIQLNNIHKRYTGKWVLEDINQSFSNGQVYGISGNNGSGKSTLIQIISGFLSASQGEVVYHVNDQQIARNDIYQFVSFAAPYTDLIEEYTILEQIDYYIKFKSFSDDISSREAIDLAQMGSHQHKRIKQLSSGLNQRIRLMLALLTDVPILILDEPTSYLDEDTKALFKQLFHRFSKNKLVILASNDQYDLELCDTIIRL